MHAYMTVPVSVAVLVYFDILLGTHVYHACAMFEILRYQELTFIILLFIFVSILSKFIFMFFLDHI